MQKFHAVFSVDTMFFSRLAGIYRVEDYTLRPCHLTKKNQLIGCSNFVLEFEFGGLDEKGIVDSSEKARRGFVNDNKSAQIAKEFVAWLVLATRRWARLSSQSSGPSMKFGPFGHYPVEDFGENILETTFHVDKKAKKGEFLEVQRPSFSLDGFGGLGMIFKLSSDFPHLTRKVYSLRRKEREKFLNACFSYQFALENWTPYPTVSILSLVSAIESMMTDEYTSGFCEDAKRQCLLKRDVMKKFRLFFERNLQYPLPREYEMFLNSVYHKRSAYVHKALLGEGEARGIQFGFLPEKVLKIRTELHKLENLVNAALMDWLKRI